MNTARVVRVLGYDPAFYDGQLVQFAEVVPHPVFWARLDLIAHTF